MVDYFDNFHLWAIGGIMTPLIAKIADYAQDFTFMFIFLVVFILVDTGMGAYIAYKNRKFTSGEKGFWKIGDKLFAYFGLILLTYSVVLVTQVVPFFSENIPSENLEYLVFFAFGVMYSREAISIIEHIDKLQPDFLPEWFKKRITKIFKREIKED